MKTPTIEKLRTPGISSKSKKIKKTLSLSMKDKFALLKLSKKGSED